MAKRKDYPLKAETTEDLKKILKLVTFVKSCIDFGWAWDVEELFEQPASSNYNDYLARKIKGWLINTTFRRPDIDTGKIGRGKGRQMFIAKGSSANSIFFSCVVCVKLIVEHEWMEAIRFNGQKVLNPHRTLEELAMPDVMADNKIDMPFFDLFVAKILKERELLRITSGMKTFDLRKLKKMRKSKFSVRKA